MLVLLKYFEQFALVSLQKSFLFPQMLWLEGPSHSQHVPLNIRILKHLVAFTFRAKKANPIVDALSFFLFL